MAEFCGWSLNGKNSTDIDSERLAKEITEGLERLRKALS